MASSANAAFAVPASPFITRRLAPGSPRLTSSPRSRSRSSAPWQLHAARSAADGTRAEDAGPGAATLHRRAALCLLPAAATAPGLLSVGPAAARPAQTLALDTSWVTESFAQGTEFSLDSYTSMRDDGARTPAFVEAIKRRLAGREGELSVVDVGTGPFALLAIAAAKAGARQVYAIEADPGVARLAREAIAASGLPEGRIQVLEGYSTNVQLPEKVDLLVAEVIGSVASEEGVYRTIRDAQARFLVAPEDPASYIPVRVQTLMAPASYAFHYMIAAEGRAAAGLTSEEGPLRLNCTDYTLALLDEPQVLEDFRYDDPQLPGPGRWEPPTSLNFTVSPARLKANTNFYSQTLGFEGVSPGDARQIAAGVARGFSGLAMWPRLVLDPAGDLVVEARAPGGGPQRSHWQTVLPLMTQAPLPLEAGDTVVVSASASFGASGAEPPKYQLRADITHYS